MIHEKPPSGSVVAPRSAAQQQETRVLDATGGKHERPRSDVNGFVSPVFDDSRSDRALFFIKRKIEQRGMQKDADIVSVFEGMTQAFAGPIVPTELEMIDGDDVGPPRKQRLPLAKRLDIRNP
ncbi:MULTISPECIES: hypothetical protein [Ensifer]|uniref:Uncharacterized protein n=1 Tax=Ensifer canadensis TaxID=555315 RepID=A0AAW4FHR5_9HYPH|nr:MULTISPECIES: hypothetical protein [Ensifer]MBM3091652.1 hypothetical protein [Ensifer canadensis]MDP9630138.1 hypothetical protein [Ensifer adhaerens]UBI74362.1 hypothetical protein J3R84_12750 [Ensifer canadensis]